MELINKLIWAVAVSFLFLSSIYFTFKLKFVQLKLFKVLSCLKTEKSHNDISAKDSLIMSLSSKIGVGSLAGIAFAIYYGGLGSVFWIWVITFLTSINCFVENILSTIYKKVDNNGCQGGPFYYIKYGLGRPFLGGIYAIMIIASYVFGFVGIQGNTITKSLQSMINIPSYIIGIILITITSLIIFGGLKKIAEFSEKLVPFMTILYLSIAVFISIKNIKILPNIFLSIFTEAFNIKAVGFGFLSTLIIGIQRGIFSNEAGLGTGSITSSTSSTDSPVSQGYIQMLGLYVTPLLICTATAIIVQEVTTSTSGSESCSNIISDYVF